MLLKFEIEVNRLLWASFLAPSGFALALVLLIAGIFIGLRLVTIIL